MCYNQDMCPCLLLRNQPADVEPLELSYKQQPCYLALQEHALHGIGEPGSS